MLLLSAGDRITVIDDSNEEWWRVSRGSCALGLTLQLCHQSYKTQEA